MSFGSNSKSIQDPRFGMMRAENTAFDEVVVLPRPESKKMPGERWSWLTTTRSVPFTMNVPLRVMRGISPK